MPKPLSDDSILKQGKQNLPFPQLGGEYGEEEIEVVTRLMRECTSDWRQGFGREPEMRKFGEAFAAYVGTKHAIAVSSCGTGLDMAMKMLDLKPGDEVITTPLTYIATTEAILSLDAARLELAIELAREAVAAAGLAFTPASYEEVHAYADSVGGLVRDNP